MSAFRFSHAGTDEVTRSLERFGGRAEDMRPALRDVSDEIRKATRVRFAAQGAGDWPPLAPATVRKKAALGQSPKILVATGALRRSLTNKRAKGSIRQVERRFVVVGTKLFYARFQTERPPIVFDRATKVRSLEMLRGYLMDRRS